MEPQTEVTIETELKARKHYTAFVVTSPHGWGAGPTLAEAKANCKRNAPRGAKPYKCEAKLVTAETTCDGMGGISYFPEYPPIELGSI